MTKQEYNRAYYAAHREEMCEAERLRRKRPGYIEKERARYKKRRPQVLAQKRIYTILHRAEKREYNRKYYTTNLAHLKVQRKIYRRKTLPQILIRNYAYWAKHPDKFRKWRDKYRANNKHVLRQHDAHRRALESKATINPKATKEFYAFISNQDVVNCSYCGVFVFDKTHEIDHIIPISKKGEHDPNNLCISCFTCNRSKNDELLSKWKKCPDRVKPLLHMI